AVDGGSDKILVRINLLNGARHSAQVRCSVDRIQSRKGVELVVSVKGVATEYDSTMAFRLPRLIHQGSVNGSSHRNCSRLLPFYLEYFDAFLDVAIAALIQVLVIVLRIQLFRVHDLHIRNSARDSPRHTAIVPDDNTWYSRYGHSNDV